MLSGLDLELLLVALYAVAHLPDVYQRVAIDDESQLVVGADVQDDRLVAGRHEGAVEACREVLEVDTRSKDGVAAVAQLDGLFLKKLKRRGRIFPLSYIFVDIRQIIPYTESAGFYGKNEH